MDEIESFYQIYVSNEIKKSANQVLDIQTLKQKCITFIYDLSEICFEARVCSFWDRDVLPDDNELLELYIQGFFMLMAIAADLKEDQLVLFRELRDYTNVYDMTFKIQSEIISIGQSYKTNNFQDIVNDYMEFGYLIGINTEVIVNRLRLLM